MSTRVTPHLILDGTLISCDRVADTNDIWYSGKATHFAGNIQFLTTAKGTPRWQAARIIKANPGKAQTEVRLGAVGPGKLLYMTVPKIAAVSAPQELRISKGHHTLRGLGVDPYNRTLLPPCSRKSNPDRITPIAPLRCPSGAVPHNQQ